MFNQPFYLLDHQGESRVPSPSEAARLRNQGIDIMFRVDADVLAEICKYLENRIMLNVEQMRKVEHLLETVVRLDAGIAANLAAFELSISPGTWNQNEALF